VEACGSRSEGAGYPTSDGDGITDNVIAAVDSLRIRRGSTHLVLKAQEQRKKQGHDR